MADPNYLTHKPPAPSVPKRFFDQQVIPLFIDAAGNFEAMIEHVAVRVRRAPAQSLGIAVGAGALLSVLLARRRW